MQHYQLFVKNAPSKGAFFVFFLTALLLATTGCMTKRDGEEIKARLLTIEKNNTKTVSLVARMDSLVTKSTEASNMLNVNNRNSFDDLTRQLQQLQQNINDITDRLEKMNRSSKGGLNSSPGATGTSSTVVSPQCQVSYDDAFVLVRKGQYQPAIDGFKKFLNDCPSHENSANAHYWIGECYYSTEKYADAISEFQYVMENFKQFDKLSTTLYKIGRSNQELNKKEEARKAYQQVINDFKGTLEAEQSKERLKDLK
jgi:tol-pal system protein YbgF